MVKLNENYQKLPGSYLFSEIARRVRAYSEAHPEKKIIRLGIGDVTRPLAPTVVEALHRASDEMGDAETFRGYGPEQGYDFLREAIAADYARRGVSLSPNEIFVSDGAKSDCGNITDLFHVQNRVAVCDPVYPVYVDTNAMAGRAGEYLADSGRWSELCYMPCTEESNFLPRLPEAPADLIYLCFPNNPTGACITREELKRWVDYANSTGAILLYDSAYEAFITQDLPHSVFEIPGARTCAMEFRSFSKTAGFTGLRCAYTVIPRELTRGGVSLNQMWLRRQCTKFNGVPYVVQRAAQATFTPQGRREVQETIDFYLENARLLKQGLLAAGFVCHGGENSPYLWLKTPENLTSWEFFDRLLHKLQLVGTPGSGFGPCGEGYFRLTSFGTREDTLEAIQRLKGF